MKVLFITSTHLGDAILSTGILEHIIQQNSGCKITIACGAVPAPLFETVPHLRNIIPLQKKKGGWHWVQLWQKCFLTRWDVVVDLRGTGLSYFLWAKKRYIWKPIYGSILKSQQLAQFIGLQQVPFNKVWLTSKYIDRARQLLPAGATYIAFSPAANWDKKSWPAAYFVELAHHLAKDKKSFPGVKFVIFGTKKQRAALQPLFEGLEAAPTINLMGEISLLEVAACLKQCKVFVGNDSGLMHLAATVGTPTVGIFGPSDPKVYGPWGPKTIVVQTPLSFEENMNQARAGKNVMKLIKPLEVVKAVREVLER